MNPPNRCSSRLAEENKVYVSFQNTCSLIFSRSALRPTFCSIARWLKEVSEAPLVMAPIMPYHRHTGVWTERRDAGGSLHLCWRVCQPSHRCIGSKR